jgi:hypothetical protein
VGAGTPERAARADGSTALPSLRGAGFPVSGSRRARKEVIPMESHWFITTLVQVLALLLG